MLGQDTSTRRAGAAIVFFNVLRVSKRDLSHRCSKGKGNKTMGSKEKIFESTLLRELVRLFRMLLLVSFMVGGSVS